MRVAVYSGSIPSTTFVEHLINGLAANGVEVFLFGKKSKPYTPTNKNIKVFVTPSNQLSLVFFVVIKSLLLLLKEPKLFFKISSILNLAGKKDLPAKMLFLGRVLPVLLNKPDIFHIQWAKSIEDFYWVKPILKAKLVVSLRGAQINYAPLADEAVAKAYLKYFPEVDYFHGVSKAIVKEAKKYGLDEAKTSVIRPAVQKTLLSQSVEHSENGVLSILSVGRFHWKKGYNYALDAMAILDKKNIDFNYTIVAGGDYEEILFQVHSLNLQDKVKLVQGLPHKDVLRMMENADLFLLPSVEEGIANVVLESMATGAPVISTNCGGMEEVIKNHVNGFLVPVRDPKAIADSVELFKSLPESDKKLMKERARETILEGHIVDSQVKAFVGLYKRVLNINSD